MHELLRDYSKKYLWLFFKNIDRYVDDIFAYFKQNLLKFIDNFNYLYSTIRFTFEIENNNWPPVLDWFITKSPSGSLDSSKLYNLDLDDWLDFNVYRKQTQNDILIPADSYDPPNKKRSAFNAVTCHLINILCQITTIKKIINFFSKNCNIQWIQSLNDWLHYYK